MESKEYTITKSSKIIYEIESSTAYAFFTLRIDPSGTCSLSVESSKFVRSMSFGYLESSHLRLISDREIDSYAKEFGAYNYATEEIDPDFVSLWENEWQIFIEELLKEQEPCEK